MRRGPLLLLPLLLAASGAGAEVAHNKPRPLDLRLQHGDIPAQADLRARGRGYAARVGEDPWRRLAGDPPPVGGPGIPRVRADERREDEARGQGGLPLRSLLEGEIFPLLTIRLSPPVPNS